MHHKNRPKRNVLKFPRRISRLKEIRIKRSKQSQIIKESLARKQAMHEEAEGLMGELDSVGMRIDDIWDKSKNYGRDLPKKPKK